MMRIWDFVCSKLEEDLKVMLMVVIQRKGSSPGKVGFKMAVAGDDSTAGSIGGGAMEFNMVELARQVLSEGHTAPFIRRQVHRPDAGEEQSGLICSGEQTHAFIPLDKKNLPVFKSLLAAVEKGKRGLLRFSQAGPEFLEEVPQKESLHNEIESDTQWIYEEITGIQNTLYIFGGGHISIPLSQLGSMLDFRVVVCDDRPGLNTMEENQWAGEKHIIDYNRAGELVEGGEHTFVVIMTIAHASDQLVLKQMLDKNPAYLGMIGSRNKVKKIFSALKQEGAAEDQLQKVDSPMGIPINSETPAEIAVSIAAKIIQEKNAKSK